MKKQKHNKKITSKLKQEFLDEAKELKVKFANELLEIDGLDLPESPKELEIEGLFNIDIKIGKFHGYTDVIMTILRWDADNLPFDPEKYLSECLKCLTGDKKYYTLKWLEESFLMDEIVQIKKYLGTFKNTIVGVPSPCFINEDGSSFPIGGLPASSGETDYYCFFNHPNYPLTFRIAGFFDLRQHEKIESKEGSVE